jgi:RHS repeat-associated protein
VRKTAARAARPLPALLLILLVVLGASPARADAPDTAIRYAYDSSGRLAGVTDPANGSAIFGYDPVGNLLSIRRQGASTVSIISINPAIAPVGATVTVTGTGFSPTASDDTLQFNGTTATVTAASATQLTATVPSGATTGSVTVTTPTGSATSDTPFTVTAGGPTIDSISPTIAPAGTAITVSGSRFGSSIAGNVVTLNSTMPEITSASSSSLQILVPVGTGSGAIGLSTTDGRTTGPDLFIPPSGYGVGDVGTTGRMAIGDTKHVTISTGGRIGLIVFDGLAGQKVSLRSVSGFDSVPNISILKPDGTTLSISTATNFIDARTLPVSGTYTIVVDPQGNDTGSTDLSLYDASDVTGSITPGGLPVTVATTTPGQRAAVTFTGTAGQRVALRESGFNADHTLSILKPDGSTLWQSFPHGYDSSAFSDAQTLPTSGTYTIVFDPNGMATSASTLALYDVGSDITGTLTPTIAGSTATVAASVPGQNGRFSFSGVAGQKVSVVAAHNSYPSLPSLSILKPDGTTLAWPSATNFVDAQTLPTTGTYTLVVDPQGNDTGSEDVTLYDASDVTGSLTPTASGASITLATQAPGQNATVTFGGTAGQRVSLRDSGFTVTHNITIKKPDGTNLWSTGPQSYDSSAFSDVQTLPTTGTYSIVFDPSGPVTSKDTLTLYDVAADVTGTFTPTVAGSTVTAATAIPGQNARYTFSGTAGQKVSVTAAHNNYPSLPKLSILKPDGSTLAYPSQVNFIDAQTLPTTGTYTLVVDPQGNDTGSEDVTLYDAGDVTSSLTPTTAGSAATMTTQVPGQNASVTFSGTAGQRVSLRESSFSVDHMVGIKKPDGSWLWQSWPHGYDPPVFSDAQTLPTTGTYTIVFDPTGPVVGSDKLMLYDVGADLTGTITPSASGGSVSVATTGAGQNAKYTFSGTAGQQISVSTSGNTYPSLPKLSILNPSGSTLVSPNATTQLSTVTLPSTGTYTIAVDPQVNDTGSLTLTAFNGAAVTPTVGGMSTTVTSTSPGQAQTVTIAGTAGQKVSVTTSGNSYPSQPSLSLLKPDGTTLYNAGATTFIDAQTLPVDGNYSLVVTPQASQTGSITVTVYDASDLTASLTPSASGASTTLTTQAPGQNAVVTFSGTAGQRVSLRESGFDETHYLSVKRPDGSQLWGGTVQNYQASQFSDALTLPTTGTYTIVSDPSGSVTESTTLTLYDVGADVGGTVTPTAAGAVVSMATSVPGQNGRYTFSGTAGQKISATASGNTYPSSPSLSILNPDGSTLCCSGSTFLDAHTLPTTGTYTLVVDPQGNDTGGENVTVYDASDATAAVTPTAAGASATVSTQAPGQAATVTFSGTAGQRVAVRESGYNQDHQLSVKKPDGTYLWNYGTVTGTTPSQFSNVLTLPTTGTYSVVSDPNGTATGSTTITVYDAGADVTGRVTPTAAGATLSVATAVPGQTARYTFSGTAGQKISAMGSANSYPSWPALSILKPDGSQLGAATNFLDAQTLPTTGTYTLVVDPQSTDVGGENVTVYDASDATASVTPSAAGASATVATQGPGQAATVTFSGTAGQRVAVRESGYNQDHQLSVKKPDGTYLWNYGTVTGSTPSQFSNALTLPTTGTYTVVSDPNGTATESTTITVYAVPADPSGTLTPTAAGAGATVTATVPGQVGRYTFAGTAGQKVSATASGNTYPTWPALSILKPDGSQLGPYATNFLDSQTLPTTGTYTLVVDPAGTDTGTENVKLYDSGDVTGSLTATSAGSSTTVSTVAPGQNASVTFSGTAGQRVSVRDSGFSVDHYFTVKKPDGSNLWSTNVSSGSGAQFTQPLTLPTTGTYTILFDPQSTATGTTTLQLWAVAADLSGTLTPSSTGSATGVSTVPGQNGTYTFSGTAGQKVAVTSTGSTYPNDPWLSLVKPDNSNLISPTATKFIDQTSLPTTGTYKLVVDPQNADAGSLTLTLYDAADVSGTISIGGSPVNVATTAAGSNARYTFSGTAGTPVWLTASSVSATAVVSILKPDGTTQTANTIGTSGGTLSTTLPTTGTYTVLVDPQGSATESMTLALTNTQPGSPKRQFTGDAHFQQPSWKQIGGARHRKHRVTRRWRKLPPLRAGRGVTALAGQALNLDGTPIAHAGVSVDGSHVRARTDRTGRFLLASIPGGHHVLSVDGRGANRRHARYGAFDIGVDVAKGRTTALRYTIWMPRLDTKTRVKLRFPLRRQVTLTTRRIPNLEVRIPAGSTIRDAHGRPISALTLTPIPVHQPPFPLPHGVQVPVYFTVQPGGAYLSKGAQIVYPNPGHIHAAARVNFWTYDPEQRGWFVYGRGTVAANGKQIMPDPGVRIWELSGAMIGGTVVAPASAHLARGSRADGGWLHDSFVHAAATGTRLILAERTAERAHHRRVHRQAKGTRRKPRSHRVSVRGHGAAPLVPARSSKTSPTWIPTRANLSGDWTSHRPDSRWSALPPLAARPGTTAISGQALKVNGEPLARVTLRIKGTNTATKTDASGRFLLAPVDSGHQVLIIDGGTAGTPRERYGYFKTGVDVVAGRTNKLEYTIWMTQLSDAGDTAIDSPTTADTVVKSPEIPGLEVRIPAGSTITDSNGHAVRSLNVTAVPVDRPPFPLPQNIVVPTYFTVQPGGAYLSKGAQIIYPNYTHLPPGQRVEFWNYDAEGKGWYVYGRGTVTPDAKQVMPDPDVRIWEFTGAMISSVLPGPNNAPVPPMFDPAHSPPIPPFAAPNANGLGFGVSPANPCSICPHADAVNPSSGDPVDLHSGLFVHRSTDLYLPDSIPVQLTRTYREGDSNSYSFGIGTTSIYDMRLWSIHNYQDADLILPDGGRVHYVRTSPGTGYTDAVYTAQAAPGAFDQSTIRWDAGIRGWDLTERDGMTYVFGEMAPLQAIRDRYGNQLTITRTSGQFGNITQLTSPHGRWIRFTYDASNRITSAHDNSGRTVSYTYDGSGRVATATDADGGTTTYTYDAASQMTSITDPRNVTVLTNTYDSNGRVLDQTLGDGAVYHFAYTLDGSGNVTQTSVTDPRGYVREVTFSGAGYPTGDTSAVGEPTEQHTAFTRDSATNRLLSSTDALGRTTSYQYDSVGDVTQVTRLAGTPSAVTTSFTYEPSYFQLASTTDGLGHTTTLGYDSKGELTSVRDATGRTTTMGYANADGLPTSITNPAGQTTALTYTSGALTSKVDPLGNVTKLFVDGAGRTTAVSDPLGNTTHYSYDAMNHLTRVTDASGGQTSFDYDAAGNVIHTTDARGHVASTTYDAMDRISSWTDPLDHTVQLTYDPNGNLAQGTESNGQVDNFTYDALNRLTDASYGAADSISYSYDAGNRLTQASGSPGGTISNSYDGIDDLVSQSGPQGSIDSTYDSAGRRTTMTASGQPTVSYSYDDANRPTAIGRSDAAASIGYDSAGRRSSTTLPDGIAELYTYDADSHVTHIDDGLGVGDLSYAYDSAGHRNAMWGSLARTALPQARGSATYDADNARTAQDGTSLTYDANGNLTSDGTTTYGWNARGQLASLTASGTSASFTYDPLGRRATRTVNGDETDYLYDGPSVAEELSGAVTKAAILGGPNPDEVLARITSTGVTTHLTDALESTIALADASGTVQTSYTYDPFGSSSATGAPSDNPYQFTGRENDGTGLYYYRARYYSPGMQAFVSQDPLGFAGSGATPYQYANDDPVDLTDPLGLEAGGGGGGGFLHHVLHGVLQDGANCLSGAKYGLPMAWATLGDSLALGCGGGVVAGDMGIHGF